MKYSYCPNCKRKGVYWAPRPNREDNYSCRHRDCQFYFFTLSNVEVDIDNGARWVAANAERGIKVQP